MKSTIVKQKDGVDIQVSDIGEHADQLMEAFTACQQGRCGCPTTEYEKVESISVEQSDEGIALKVKSKDGTELDVAEIEKCLAHTKSQIE